MTSYRAAIVIVAVVTCHCASPKGEDARHPVIKVATGRAGTGFHSLGTALVESFRRTIPGIAFESVETPGSVWNVEALQQGDADVGLTSADVAYIAYTGHLPARPQLFGELRAVALLYLAAVHVLVRADSGISSIAQLGGRRVNMGEPGGGTAWTSALLLEAFNVPLSSVQQYSLPSVEAARRLTRGDLDAVFVLSADPSVAVQQAIAGGARLLEIDNDTLVRLRDTYPFLRPALTPELNVGNRIRPAHTVGIDTVLLVRASLSEQVVSEITRAFFEALPQLGTSFHTHQLVEPNRAAATPIPLHPGAARYYRERELFR